MCSSIFLPFLNSSNYLSTKNLFAMLLILLAAELKLRTCGCRLIAISCVMIVGILPASCTNMGLEFQRLSLLRSHNSFKASQLG